MFKEFTGWQYLLIDLANSFGHDLDKMLFEERIEWAEHNLDKLEGMTDLAEAKTRPLFVKATMAIRKAQAKQPTGHLVGFDAICSGIQVMSALTGCVEGAKNTGLIDTGMRPDAYSKCTSYMNETLGGGFTVPRKQAKDALMTNNFGSVAKPKEIFGEDTPELNAFYLAAQKTAPGAWDLLQELKAAWQPWAKKHSWKMPDGYDVVVKVMVEKTARVEVDELNHTTFTYEFRENEGTKTGISLPANLTHSTDGFVLREIHRRCNYDLATIRAVAHAIGSELDYRSTTGIYTTKPMDPDSDLAYYYAQYTRSGMASAGVLPHVTKYNTCEMETEWLQKLMDMAASMLKHRPFPVVTVHDEFRCHANHMNHLRQHYINIFAELAESNLLTDLFQQITGIQRNYVKLSNNLGALIRESNYALT